MSVIRLIQLSDCHISASRDGHYRGQHALVGLEAIVSACRNWRPDIVVASGDLSEDASAASYALLAQSFLQLEADVFLMPGNHDDVEVMRQAFTAPVFHVSPEYSAGNWHFYFLDSTIPGIPAGRVESARANELAEQINTQAEPYAVVFLHHQPFESGSAWIDKYPLLRAQEFRATLAGCEKLRAVGWGHIHHGWEFRDTGVTWLGCPATSTNTLQGHEKFTCDERGPACRWLELSETGAVATGLLYGRIKGLNPEAGSATGSGRQ